MSQIRKLILKIFIENCGDLNEERKDDNKYHQQATDIYKLCLDIIKANSPNDDNTYTKNDLNLPFDIVFIYSPNAIFNASYKNKEETIVVNCRQFPNEYNNEKYARIFELFKSVIIHEIIHFIDIQSRNIPVDPEYINKNDSYNNHIEINAYFHQFADPWYVRIEAIKNSKAPLDDFYLLIGADVRQFSYKFWTLIKKSKYYDLINADQKFRWNKRIYDLYFNLKDKLVEYISKSIKE